MIKKTFFVLALLLMVSPMVVFAQGTGFGLDPAGPNSGSDAGWNPSGLSATGLPTGSISGIIMGVMFWLLAMLGVFGVIGFAIAGILYLVSTGDETMAERAKEAMKYSIIGIVVGLLGVVVIQAIDMMLNQFSNF